MLTPYELVYGKKLVIPIEFEIETLHTDLELGMSLSEAQKAQLAQLYSLDEMLHESLHHIEMGQHQQKKWHDHFIQLNAFKPSDWVLLYDSHY